MSKIQDALAAQSATDDTLADEVTQLVTLVQGFPTQEAADLKAALAAAGVDDDANATIVAASTARLQGFADKLATLLPAAPPAPPELALVGQAITGPAGSPVSGQFQATGGTGPYTYAASDNPGDISVGTDGTLSGTPQQAEAGTFTVTATDATGATVTAAVDYTITA